LLYMIVERFKTPGGIDVYRRAREHGRMMPKGLEYISSWVDYKFETCFQLMKTENKNLIDEWIDHWKDLVEFDVVAVQTSAEAVQAIAPLL